MAEQIDLIEAAKWVLRAASAEGAITPNSMKVVAEFAAEYGLDLATLETDTFVYRKSPVAKPIVEEVSAQVESRPLKTKSEYYRQLRSQTNARLQRQLQQRSVPGVSNYMQDKISVKMPDGKIIAEKYNIDSLIKIVQTIGYEKVAALNIMHFNKYPIVTREPIGKKYKGATLGWYVLSDSSTKYTAIHVNEIADALDINMIADVVAK
jgi:hypothetical protein